MVSRRREIGRHRAGLGCVMTRRYPPVIAHTVVCADPRPPVARVLFPAPLVTSREPWPDDVPVPSSVKELCADGVVEGWLFRRTYSRGFMPHATTGRPGAEKHLIAVRFGGHRQTARQAYAVYERPVRGKTWAWASVWGWGPALPPVGLRNVTTLRTFLGTWQYDDAAMLAWVDWMRLKGRDVSEAV